MANASARDEEEVVEQVVELTLNPRPLNMSTVFARRRRLLQVRPRAPGRPQYTVETIEFPYYSSDDEAEGNTAAEMARRLTGVRHCFNPDTEDLLALFSSAFPGMDPRVFNYVAERCRVERYTTIGTYGYADWRLFLPLFLVVLTDRAPSPGPFPRHDQSHPFPRRRHAETARTRSLTFFQVDCFTQLGLTGEQIRVLGTGTVQEHTGDNTPAGGAHNSTAPVTPARGSASRGTHASSSSATRR